MTTLVKRTVFGAIYVAIIVLACLVGVPYFFGAIFLTLSVMSVHEFCHITHTPLLQTIYSMLLTACLFCLGWEMNAMVKIEPTVIFCLLYIIILIISIVTVLFQQEVKALEVCGNLLIGQLFIAFPFFLMNFLITTPYLLLALFIVIWINDTGAYCVGSLIGKHKMIPRVSPGKTWEGLVGGIVFGMAASYLLFADTLHWTGLNYGVWESLILSFVIVVFGTLGDLIESLMKRNLGIKDSGNILPGHGGFLDRFDSVLLATVAMSLTLLIFKIF